MATTVYTFGGKVLRNGAKLCTKTITPPAPAFTVQVVTTGAANFTVALTSPVDLLIDWGDESSNTYNTNGSKVHSYAGAGTYVVEFTSGTADKIAFGLDGGGNNNGNLKAVLTPVPAWLGLTSARNMFSGNWYCASFCADFFDAASANVTDFHGMLNGVGAVTTRFNEDVSGWDVSNATDLSYTFAYCYPFAGTGMSGWDVGNVTTMANMLNWCYLAFNPDISGWDTHSLTTMANMCLTCNTFNRSLAAWDVTGVTTMANFTDGAHWSTANYSATLIGWESQAVQTGVALNVGTGKYSAGAAATARQALIDDHTWTITDGGQA